jgi:hypothetical protein
MCSLKGAADQTTRLRGIEVAGNVATCAHVRQRETALDARIDHGGAARRLVEMGEKKGVNGRPGVGALARGRQHEMNLVGGDRAQESLELPEALAILGTDARRVDDPLVFSRSLASTPGFHRADRLVASAPEIPACPAGSRKNCRVASRHTGSKSGATAATRLSGRGAKEKLGKRV